MSEALDLKLGRLASNLLGDLNELDAVNFGHKVDDQKAALIVEALGEAIRYAMADTEYVCEVPGCTVDHIGRSRRPDSLIDRKG